MRLSARYQPETLSKIVGQPAPIRRLKTFALEPYPSCWLLEGGPGSGKSSAAKALIHDLGVSDYSVASYAGAGLKIEDVRRLFGQTFRTVPMFGSPWSVLLLEELEHTASGTVTTTLKNELSEQNMPSRLIVVATSNNPLGLDKALLDRFEGGILSFSSGPSFAADCVDRLGEIWASEVGPDVPMPPEVANGGWKNGCYSMRRAINTLAAAVECRVLTPKKCVLQ